MKKLLLPAALAVSLLFCSCSISQKLFDEQQYDQVILRTAPKVCAGQATSKEAALVAESYHRANQADHERILSLKATGQPDVWPEIYERYLSMKGREEALDCFPSKLKRNIGYTHLDLDDELKGARNKAEAYLVAKISQVLHSETPDLDQADKLIRDLEHVNSKNPRITEFKLQSLAKRYGGIDRLMHLEVTHQEVGPNRDETVTFQETQRGLTATVTDHKLSKSAKVKGTVNFIDPQNKQKLLTVPYEMTSNFEHNYTTIEGAREACSEQTLERLKQAPAPFPTDESMVADAKRKVIDMIYQKIQ